MNLKYSFCIFLGSILLSGCTQSSNQQNVTVPQATSEQPSINDIAKKPEKPISKSSYKSQSGYYYALIEKNDRGWTIVEIRDTAMDKRQNENQEILRVNQSYAEVIPYYKTTNFHRLGDTYECSYMLKPTVDQYSPCSSQLTSASVAKSIGKNIIAAAVTFGLASGSHRYIDENLINEAVVQTDLFNAIENEKTNFEQALYERTFYNARTIADYDKFIADYTSKDKENFIPTAIKNRDQLIEKQKAEQKKLAEENKKKQEEQLAQAKAEQKASDERKKNVESFRKSLKSGMDSNCGPILEVKDSLIKIYFPVQNYGNEHWIKRDEMFPKGYGCRFVNGGYIMPSSY